jgi:hypothetical protein
MMVLHIDHQQGRKQMTTEDLIAKVHAKRKAAGLCVSFDRETPELTAELGRTTGTYATIKDRDERIDELKWLGRNPRIEGLQ